MSCSKNSPSKFSNPLSISLVILCLIAIILVGFFFLSDQNKITTKQPLQRQSENQLPNPTAKFGRDDVGAYDHGKREPQRPKPRARELQSVASQEPNPVIGELLSNDQLSHDETARQLAQIVLDPNAPEAERLEAMEHGKNLGFSHLLPLSLDPNLPLPLVESYLHGLHGHDQTKEQVSGALGLLNHSDSDIRQQAQTLLGFLLEAEEDNESPEKLREKADAFLKKPDEMGEEVIGQ